MNFNLVLDWMLFVYCQLEDRMVIKVTIRLCTFHARLYTSLKSNIVMTHDLGNNKQEQLNSILD